MGIADDPAEHGGLHSRGCKASGADGKPGYKLVVAGQLNPGPWITPACAPNVSGATGTRDVAGTFLKFTFLASVRRPRACQVRPQFTLTRTDSANHSRNPDTIFSVLFSRSTGMFYAWSHPASPRLPYPPSSMDGSSVVTIHRQTARKNTEKKH